MVLDWVACGRKKGTRQALLDRVIWWRGVIYTISGHFGGAVMLGGTSSRDDRHGDLLEAWNTFCTSEHGQVPEVDEWKLELRGQEFLARKRQQRFARYVELCCHSRNEAEAYLGSLLKPKLSVKLCFSDQHGITLLTPFAFGSRPLACGGIGPRPGQGCTGLAYLHTMEFYQRMKRCAS